MKFESTKFLLDHVENVFESEVFKCSSTDVTTKTHIFHIQYTAKSFLLTNNNIPGSCHVHIGHLTSPEWYMILEDIPSTPYMVKFTY